jgi:hypothetical protein
MQVKLQAKSTMTKIESTGNSKPYIHFIEHIAGAFEKTQQPLEKLESFDPATRE